MPKRTGNVPVKQITQSILVFRGHKVLLDNDLAELYGVPTKRLNEQVKRNADRFPGDFLFRLTSAEVEALNRSQFATGSQKHRDTRLPPYAFTEHGAIMAAMILNSSRAVPATAAAQEPAHRIHCGTLGEVIERSPKAWRFPLATPLRSPARAESHRGYATFQAIAPFETLNTPITPGPCCIGPPTTGSARVR